jgi:hypothetical protein
MSDPLSGLDFLRWVARTFGALSNSGQALAFTFLEDLSTRARLWNCAVSAGRIKRAKLLAVERTHRADAERRMAEAAKLWAERAKLVAEAGRTDAEADHIRAQARALDPGAGVVSALTRPRTEVLTPEVLDREQREAALRVQEAINALRAMGGEVIIEVRVPNCE